MLTLNDGRVVDEQAMFSEIGARIRDVRTGPDGMLYLLTDSEQGKVIRVVPVSDPANQANLSAAMTTEQGQ
jgi:glucose/arabinose dehydrogenase